ncbi:MAG: TIGR01777 family protein [Lentisphaeraceae bacterium]|nr:TIGR01777 family protein [Lentisphaeraceae bacterium]
MPIFEKKSHFPVSAEDLFAWHERLGTFERLVPPWEKVEMLSQTGGIEVGARKSLLIGSGITKMSWEALHTACEKPTLFEDKQESGPFAKWLHTHKFDAIDAKNCKLTDQLDYALPMGMVGQLLGGNFISKTLKRTFCFRHRRTLEDILQHKKYQQEKRQRILVSGASGVVGRQLCAFLTTGGHDVWRLVRKIKLDAEKEILWDPQNNKIDKEKLEGFDVVIHLAGENVDGRWTTAKKKRILDSRVFGTRLLSKTLSELNDKPSVFIGASGVSYYGNHASEIFDEDSPRGTGFLADVVEAWEGETRSAKQAGIRVVNLRIGVVLTLLGGALKKMVVTVKLGFGGRIGSGEQFFSWILLDDLIGIIYQSIFDEDLSGPINAVAPGTLSNAEFIKTLARVLQRPAVFAVPTFVIKLLFGQMGEETVLGSLNVRSTRLKKYDFLYPSLDMALRAEFGLV